LGFDTAGNSGLGFANFLADALENEDLPYGMAIRHFQALEIVNDKPGDDRE